MALQLRTKSFILHEMLTFQESMEIDFLNKTQSILYLGFPYLFEACCARFEIRILQRFGLKVRF